MKILYAAGNNFHGKIQADRFLSNLDKNKFQIKVSAWKNFLPESGADWILDPLIFPGKGTGYLLSDNRYLDIYQSQVKSFDPDLIISDLEIFTSFIALSLNKKLWHVSNMLHNFAINFLFKKNINLFKYYKYAYQSKNILEVISTLIKGADKNYLYSHFCDVDEKICLKENFHWIRPYYQLGKSSTVAHHQYVAVKTENFETVTFLKSKQDSVLFSLYPEEYSGITVKSLLDEAEYSLNLKNCNYYVCDASASFLADAFYNERKMILVPTPNRVDCLFNNLLYYKIYQYLLEDNYIIPTEPRIDKNVLFLHQEIEKNYSADI